MFRVFTYGAACHVCRSELHHQTSKLISVTVGYITETEGFEMQQGHKSNISLVTLTAASCVYILMLAISFAESLSAGLSLGKQPKENFKKWLLYV